MIQDIIMNLVKSQIGSIFSNTNVPQEHQEGITQAASEAISNGVKEQANSGPQGLSDIVRLLGNRIGSNQSASVSKICESFINTITQRFGVDQGTASNMASTLIPNVLNSLTQMIKDPKEAGITLNGVLNSLTDGKTNGLDLQSILDQNHDGTVDAKDAMCCVKRFFSKLFSGQKQHS